MSKSFYILVVFLFSFLLYGQEEDSLKQKKEKPFIELLEVKRKKEPYRRNPKLRSSKFDADSIKKYRHFPGKIFLTKKVVFSHQGMVMKCDSAVWDEKNEFFEAYGERVFLKQDTVKLYAHKVTYDAKIQYAKAFDEVLLKSKNSTIETNQLDYDKANQVAFYNDWGTIFDGENTLTSKVGKYNITTNQYLFKEEVRINSIDQIVDAENVVYFTDTKHMQFYGNARIQEKGNPQNYIYTENGDYNTQTKIANLYLNNQVNYNDKTLIGDRIFFNRLKGFGYAKGNVTLDDPLEERIIYGDYGEVYQMNDSAFVTGNALAEKRFEKDTLYVHADTLLVYKQKIGQDSISHLSAYHYAKFKKGDLSGKSDSIHFDEKISRMDMVIDPILFTKNQQISGDSIHFWLNQKTEKLDSLKVVENAFVISRVDTLDITKKEYNQIKGKYLTAFFEKNNQLKKVNVNKNTQGIFYVDEEATEEQPKSRIGINKSKCGYMDAYFFNNSIDRVYCVGKPDSNTYPETEIDEKDLELKGYRNRLSERIIWVEDLYVHSEKYTEIRAKLIEKQKEIQNIKGIQFPEKNKGEEPQSIQNKNSEQKIKGGLLQKN